MVNTQRKPRKHPPVWADHAVGRLLERGESLETVMGMKEAIKSIVKYGVTVENNGPRHVKRGEFQGEPIHVVVEKSDTIITLYFADEWQSHITVTRNPKETNHVARAVV